MMTHEVGNEVGNDDKRLVIVTQEVWLTPEVGNSNNKSWQ